MSWETVSAAIRFWTGPSDTWDGPSQNAGVPFTEADQVKIRSLVKQLYDGSSYAQALLEGGASGGKYISFVQTSPGFAGYTYAGSGIAGFNFEGISHLYILNSKGELVQIPPILGVVHELFHAISSTLDPEGSSGTIRNEDLNDPHFDDVGQTVTDTNIVAAQ